jgi:hypothetical protein
MMQASTSLVMGSLNIKEVMHNRVMADLIIVSLIFSEMLRYAGIKI